MKTSEQETLPSETLDEGHDDRPERPTLALVLVWSRDEPARIGELLAVPALGPRRWLVAGRSDDCVPLEQVRPGRHTATGPLRSPHLSRHQLRFRRGDGGVEVENAGRAELYVDEWRRDSAQVTPGQTLRLGRYALFLCVERPPMPAEPFPAGPFGQADPVGLVGESPAMWALRRRVQWFASRPDHVLVTGPSGSGKELVGRALHRLSERRDGPWVSRNAATMPETLIDAELFGNVRGFPNPGMHDRPGLIGEANGGTLFLDEIGELPQALQTHLLRVLDAGEYTRLGESRARMADLRVVGATNRPTDELRPDFLARFQGRIRLPGLDARREDVPLLIRALLRGEERLLDDEGEPRVGHRLVRALVQGAHPVNVRGLAVALRDALASDPEATRLELPRGVEVPAPAAEEGVDPWSLTREQIVEALEQHDGVQARATEALGLKNRWVLRKLLAHHGIEVKR